MSRKAADPTSRIELLKAARKVARKDDILNAEEMAKVARMTWRNLKEMIDADLEFPVQRRGSEGSSWEFEAVKVLDHMLKRCREQLAERDAAQQRIARLTGVKLDGRKSDSLSIRDMLEVDRIQRETQRRKVEQRQLVQADEMRSVMTGLVGIVQGAVSTMVSRLDPAGRLPPEVRALMTDELRNLLVRIHDEFGEWLDADVLRASRARGRSRAAGKRRVLSKREGAGARA